MVPLLETREKNPHATLITLFMNAVEEFSTDEERTESLDPQSRVMKTISGYLHPNVLLEGVCHPNSSAGIKLDLAGEMVKTYDHIFTR